MSTRPAELLGLPGGSLRPGAVADLIVIDLDVPWIVDPAELKSQCKNTPFDEAKFSGRVTRTIVGGRTVHEQLCRIQMIGLYVLGSALHGLSARLDPVRGGVDENRRPRRICARSAPASIGATNVLRTGRKGLAVATFARRCAQGDDRPSLSQARFGGPDRGDDCGCFRSVSRPSVSDVAEVQRWPGRRRPISASCSACSGRRLWCSASPGWRRRSRRNIRRLSGIDVASAITPIVSCGCSASLQLAGDCDRA